MKISAMASYDQSPPDEGYSEYPLSLRMPFSASMPQWFLEMSVTERTGYVMSIISQLPTSQVAEIVSRLRPRLYINFFDHLPDEVLLHILSFLDPTSLINSARASRQWMSLALDSRLWEQLYLLEGFKVIGSEVRRSEERLSQMSIKSAETYRYLTNKMKACTRCNKLTATEVPRVIENNENPRSSQKCPHIFSQWGEKKKIAAEHLNQPLPTHLNFVETYGSYNNITTSLSQRHDEGRSRSIELESKLNIFSLFVPDYHGAEIRYKLNWQSLYSQRRRLESNWESKKYINFQLPHPSHPEEAHSECIYTIQHFGNYLVSGSRDKTIRIWNLETRRLVRSPLRAHSGSVLCLQFDADPREDLIVSGSSDATIILWEFSTGRVIQRLQRAHKESVLNVQFDKRVLVTCSKDKTIKIFNRKPIHASDPGYPIDIKAVDSVPTVLNEFGFNPTPTAELLIKPPYSLIAILEGHGAAVNAIQIQGNEVVSASGDRLVKIWNWPEKTCVRTLIGHSKGIACVQYDGRRIVSGSSDNEVKVFDKETGLEVASLRAHTNLVRTVQAGFGDIPSSSKENLKAVNYDCLKVVDSGTTLGPNLKDRRRVCNAGSNRSRNMNNHGSKLPPGGGGGRFGRIVSGSYDETIIIWRRDKEGIWKAQHTLSQEEAAQAAVRNTQVYMESPEALSREIFYQDLIKDAVYNGPNALRCILAAHPQILSYKSYLKDQISRLPHDVQLTMEIIIAAAISSSQNMAHSYSQPYVGSGFQSITSKGHPLMHQIVSSPSITMSDTSIAIAARQQSVTTTNNRSAVNLVMDQSSTSQTIVPEIHNLPNQHNTTNLARVFKLQFDARRIICCSQTNIILGWDFANNDKKIIEASRLFASIE